jgi:hypothetical protein
VSGRRSFYKKSEAGDASFGSVVVVLAFDLGRKLGLGPLCGMIIVVNLSSGIIFSTHFVRTYLRRKVIESDMKVRN